ncbi:hypothetical protein QOZ94_003306 [Xanthobacter agilis]|jgi:hypothetical protein|uniref:Uncharacterized protein n=1 Tax=Xanthobacter agilis TaxID=47492 RepID=A0ABU0LH89_XANAG|nr:hypothetical protein [Xanthobacter agilis]
MTPARKAPLPMRLRAAMPGRVPGPPAPVPGLRRASGRGLFDIDARDKPDAGGYLLPAPLRKDT